MHRVLPSTNAKLAVTAVPGVLPPKAIPAQQLLNNIAQFGLQQGSMTPDQANQIRQNFHSLVLQGAAALPAIREFLQKNQDLNFGAQASPLVGYGSLRAGLLDALSQIGGSEAQALLVQTLGSTADPNEIALLARMKLSPPSE